MTKPEGIPGAPGIARGPAWIHRPPDLTYRDQAADVSQELARLNRALLDADKELQGLAKQSGQVEADILAAQRLFLDDPMLVEQTRERILQGMSAASAWRECVRSIVDQFQAIAQEPWRSRADEVRDVGDRVLRLLLSVPDHDADSGVLGMIIVARNLVASQVLGFVRQGALGFILGGGSPTSHAVIMAKALRVPMALGLGEGILDLAPDTLVQVDGATGGVEVIPGDSAGRPSPEPSSFSMPSPGGTGTGPVFTSDGRRIRVLANVSTLQDVGRAVQLGAEGAGLVRTEFLFLDRDSPPSESDQAVAYAAILEGFGGRPVSIRTWDLAPDKAGWRHRGPQGRLGHYTARGIRQSLRDPNAFMAQLCAAFRAGAMVGRERAAGLSILFPHVTTIEEMRAARGTLDRVRDKLAAEGAEIPPVPVGVMIEVPAAALMVDALAQEVDHISIGSNDLAQYLMAADRDDQEATVLLGGFQPALLRLSRQVLRAGHDAGLKVTLCGELASDLESLPLMIGLGFDGLSVAVESIPAVKAAISRANYAEVRRIADAALQCATAAEVRDLAHRAG